MGDLEDAMLWLLQTWTWMDHWELAFLKSWLSVRKFSWSVLLSALTPCTRCSWYRFCPSQDKVKKRELPQKYQQCFTSLKTLPLEMESCKKIRIILKINQSILSNLNLQSQTSPFCGVTCQLVGLLKFWASLLKSQLSYMFEFGGRLFTWERS